MGGRIWRWLARSLALATLVAIATGSRADITYAVTERTQQAILTEYTAILEDASGRLSLDDVRRATSDRFHYGTSNTLRIGFSRSAYWLRFTLSNTTAQPRLLVLNVDKPSLGQLTLYAPTAQGRYQARSGGVHTDQVIGDQPHYGYVFRLALPANQSQTYYLRVNSDFSINVGLRLLSESTLAQESQQVHILMGISVGLLAGLVLVSLLVFGRRDDHAIWQFAAYVGALALYLLSNTGYLGVLWLAVPGLQNLLLVTGISLMQLLALVFARSFLDLEQHAPRLDQLIRVYLGLLGALVLAGLFWTPQIAPVTVAATIVSAFLALLAGSWRLVQGFRPALYYLVARLILTLTAVIYTLATFGVIPLLTPAAWPMVVAASVDAILLLLGLNLRHRLRQDQAAEEHEASAIANAETRARSQFLAQISHDIRTPMSGILGMTELLLDTPLTPNQREYTRTIHASSNSLLRTLNDLLDYTRMEAGTLSVVDEPFDLSSLLNDCMNLFKSHAEEKQLELIALIDPQVPAHVLGDPTRLRQVISNLLRNAIRHTHHGEVVVHVSSDDSLGHGTRFEIRDTGIGIPRQQLDTLFDVGVGRPAIGRADAGTGLGLSICRQLVELMGGRIGADSHERQGSCFWFVIPLKPQEGLQDSALPHDERLRGRRLLVVDDNRTCARVIEQQAMHWGMKVQTAETGAQALAMARTAANLAESYDIILLDHNMPGMSGLQLAARLKEDSMITNDVIVIMLTGISIAPTATVAANAGIRRVLTKPVTERQLKQAVVEELEHLHQVEDRAQHDELVDDSEAVDLSRLHVLIAEDNHLSQKVIRGMLSKMGVATTIVANGREVVEEISRNPVYDMVLMDCEMPFMDGYVATEAIREWERATKRRPIPILALTAHILDEHKQRCLAVGMNEHLAKPVELPELRSALKRWAPRRRNNVAEA